MIKIGPYGVKPCFDTKMTPVEKVLQNMTDASSIVDTTICYPSLEEIIPKIYQNQDSRSSSAQHSMTTRHFQRKIRV